VHNTTISRLLGKLVVHVAPKGKRFCTRREKRIPAAKSRIEKACHLTFFLDAPFRRWLPLFIRVHSRDSRAHSFSRLFAYFADSLTGFGITPASRIRKSRCAATPLAARRRARLTTCASADALVRNRGRSFPSSFS